MTQIIAEDLEDATKNPVRAGCSFLVAIFFCLIPLLCLVFGFLVVSV